MNNTFPDDYRLVIATIKTKSSKPKYDRYIDVLYYVENEWFKTDGRPIDNNTKVINWKYQDEIIRFINNQKYVYKPKYAVEKKFNFAAAHALEYLNDDHPCTTIHGHNYTLTVRIESSTLDDSGFVIDFSIISKNMKEHIDAIDHSFMIPARSIDKIKDIPMFKKIFKFPIWCNNTTSENICLYFHRRVRDILDIRQFKYDRIIIKISETDNNLAEYSE